MLKQMAWNTFKNTGNIDTFMELMEVQNVEKNIEKNVGLNLKNGSHENLLKDIESDSEYGNNQNKGNSNFRK